MLTDKKLGFGFMRLPIKDMSDRSTIDMDELFKMVDTFIDSGFSYFDLAYIYHNGACEKAFNNAVASRYPREKYVKCLWRQYQARNSRNRYLPSN